MPLLVTMGLGSGEGGGLILGGVASLPGGVLMFSLDDPALTPVLTGPAAVVANWSITGPTSATVDDVYISDKKVVLRTTHPLQHGGSYALHVPLGLASNTGVAYNGPFVLTFTASGDVLTILTATVIDARVLQVMFNAPADASALDPTNYTLSGGLSFVSVEKVTDIVYRLTTSHQLIGSSYDVDCPGVIAGEPYYPVTPPLVPSYVYYGVAAVPGAYDSAFIAGLATQLSSKTLANTIEFPAAGAGEFAFYAFPQGYGTPQAAVDTTSWLAYPFDLVASAVMVSGVPYNIYKSSYSPTQPFVTRWY
jgi:hypothetical protein